MAGSFIAGVQALIDQIGSGKLKGTCEVDQVYAHRQHEETTWKHPRGGDDHYLQRPLFERYRNYMRNLAENVVNPEGESNLTEAMMDNMEDLSAQVEVLAPVDLTNLRRSGHPYVTSDGAIAKDRAPKQHRLTPEELKRLRRSRGNLR